MERDEEPVPLRPRSDFEQALMASETAQATWHKVSYSRRKELVDVIEAAKKPETRARRIEKAIAELTAGS